MQEGLTEQAAEIYSQKLNIVAMLMFCCSRFINTYLMKFFKPTKMLIFFSICAIILLLPTIFVGGRAGIYSLVAVSVCMSLMFPTIYALALGNIEKDTEIGSAGLIMAILGGSLLPALQAVIIDSKGLLGISSMNISFVIPMICFVVVMIFGIRTTKRIKN